MIPHIADVDAAGPPRWNPSMGSPAVAGWFDTYDRAHMVFSSGVSQWNSRNGAACFLTQPTSAKRPLGGTGSGGQQSDVTCFGARYFLTNNWPAGDWDCYVVLAHPSSQAFADLFWDTANSQAFVRVNVSSGSGTKQVGIGLTSGGFTQIGSLTVVVPNNSPNPKSIVSVQMPSSSKLVSVGINGSPLQTAGSAFTSSAPTWFGSGGAAEANGMGFLGEAVVCGSNLNASDRARVEGYLAWRWNLQASLPSGHTYRYEAPLA